MSKQLVRYCPGSMPGSPAWMSRAEAEAYLAQDTRTMDKLEAVNSLTAPAHWPHVGGTCPACKHTA